MKKKITVTIVTGGIKMSSVHEMDFLGKETVSVSGRSGAQNSVVSTRR